MTIAAEWLAAQAADVPLMRLLVELGADPLLPNADNCTPLLFWDETYNFANLVTRITGVLELRLGESDIARVGELGTVHALEPVDALTWAMARGRCRPLRGARGALGADRQ